MFKKTVAIVAIFMFLSVAQANAASINVTLPEYSSVEHQSTDPFPFFYDVGTFNFSIPVGEQIVSAMISGQWGNSAAGSTAHNTLFLDGVQVADTLTTTPNPYYTYTVPWSYSFSDFSVLNDGSADFVAQMNSEYIIRLGETSLSIETAPVPEPASMLLGLLSLIGGALGLKRRV